MVKTGLLSAVLLVTLFAIISTSEAGPLKLNPSCGNTFCLAVYKPVCGTDGNTYSNSCRLDIARCGNPGLRVHCEGRCGECGDA
ncbi:turripeptide OL11-like [Macrobrachium rosenbergii]|uniref:turripeptide OL11-like n=1 Tax=Macrobrachium rosenbergii TaxID=79674 RepID=UPI0034D3CD02